MRPATAFPSLAVEARDLGCIRGGRSVFLGVSFTARNGELLAVRGPNGSGKSTLLRLLAGLLPLESGTLAFARRREDEPLAHYLGHADALKPTLSVSETLHFWAILYGEHPADAGIRAAATRVGLAHALPLPAGVLSAGQRRRAGLARLLLAPRPLWLLDEPTAALDTEGEALLGQLIAAHLAAGGLAIVASHDDFLVQPNAVLDLGVAT